MEHWFSVRPEVAIAFSGGVDSAYLLLEAQRHAARVKAYYVRTPFQAESEVRQAVDLAQELGIPMELLQVDTLAVPCIQSNPSDRCYHCKRHMFTAILEAAKRDGFSCVLEGTNASDDVADRPGYRALQELGIQSPLRQLGLTKEQIRLRCKEAGLPVWNKPANACLATRIPTGTPITQRDLDRTEQAEAFLSQLGFSGHRVRSMQNTAKLQLRQQQFPLLLTHREAILKELRKQYSNVLLDLEVRND